MRPEKNSCRLCLLLAAVVSLGAACTAGPIAEDYRNAAKAETATFSRVLQNPDAYIGGIVLWGGIILDTMDLEDGTRFVVLETPLGGGERPASAARSRGRFIALSASRLNPAIYGQARKITLAGQVIGMETLTLRGETFICPVVAVKQLFLWERRPNYLYPDVQSPTYRPWRWGPYWETGPPDRFGDGLD